MAIEIGSTVELTIGEPTRGVVTSVYKKVSPYVTNNLGEVGHVTIEWEDGLQENEGVGYAYEGEFIEVREVDPESERATETADPTEVLAERDPGALSLLKALGLA